MYAKFLFFFRPSLVIFHCHLLSLLPFLQETCANEKSLLTDQNNSLMDERDRLIAERDDFKVNQTGSWQKGNDAKSILAWNIQFSQQAVFQKQGQGIGLGRDFISGCFRNSAGEAYRSRYTYYFIEILRNRRRFRLTIMSLTLRRSAMKYSIQNTIYNFLSVYELITVLVALISSCYYRN